MKYIKTNVAKITRGTMTTRVVDGECSVLGSGRGVVLSCSPSLDDAKLVLLVDFVWLVDAVVQSSSGTAQECLELETLLRTSRVVPQHTKGFLSRNLAKGGH